MLLVKITKICLSGVRPFKEKNDLRLGELNCIVGKNDSGKSSILRALEIFFKENPEPIDYNRDSLGSPMTIQVSFSTFPSSICIEEDVQTTFKEENLLDSEDNITIKKIFNLTEKKSKAETKILAVDYTNKNYRNLTQKKEKEINDILNGLGLEPTKSGSGITNKEKREQIRNCAETNQEEKQEMELDLDENKKLKELLSGLYPSFSLFKAEEEINEDKTDFQKVFKGMLDSIIQGVPKTALELTQQVKDELDKASNEIYGFLKEYAPEITEIKTIPSFNWKNSLTVSLELMDNHQKNILLSERGAGIRRLLMVAYFQYLAEINNSSKDKNTHKIFCIEEPETFLHPGAQRNLIKAFLELAKNNQILITTHSPVFCGSTNVPNISLVIRNGGISTINQALDMDIIANELGIESSDQIHEKEVIVFVEGPDDTEFFEKTSKLLFEGKKISDSLSANKIGFISGGGSNIQHLVNLKAIRNLNRKFVVIRDSDRTSATSELSTEKINLIKKCEDYGGKCIILRKRELENYLPRQLIQDKLNVTGKLDEDYSYSDIKSLTNNKILKTHIPHLTISDVLCGSEYEDKGKTKYEFIEIFNEILNYAKDKSNKSKNLI